VLLLVYLLVCVLTIHSALLLGAKELLILALFMGLLLLASFAIACVQHFLTSCTISVNAPEVVLTFNKRGFLPVPGARMTLSFSYDQTGEGGESRTTFSIPAGETTISFHTDLEYKGSGTYAIKKCTLSDFFGFFRFPIKDSKKIQGSCDLLPVPEDVALFVPANKLTGKISDHSITVKLPGDDSSETLDIRAYRPGDRISRMHWKLSAKKDDLMIREFARESDSQYLFVLAFKERSQRSFSTIVSNYASIAESLLKKDMNNDVLWCDAEGVSWLEHVNTPDDLESVLSLVFHTFNYKDYPDVKRGEIPLFTPFSGELVLEDFREKSSNTSFVKEFMITDEPLDVLMERWSADET